MEVNNSCVITRYSGEVSLRPADWKQRLAVMLCRYEFLDGKTEQVVINCNSGAISDIKVITRQK